MDAERRRRILILVTVLCVGAWALDSLVVEPLLASWQARSQRIGELERDLAASANLVGRESQMQARWKEMLDGALPAEVSDAERAVLQAVGAWATDSRLSVTSVKPRWIDGIAPGSRLLQIQVEGTGDMEALSRFVYGLESDPLPLRVEELEITAEDDAATRLALSARFTGLVLEKSPT